jgi:hypothetical protein
MLEIETIKHNHHIVITNNNLNKKVFVGYSLNKAIKEYKKIFGLKNKQSDYIFI